MNHRKKREAVEQEKIEQARAMTVITSKARLTPTQSAQIRGQIAEYMRSQIEIANLVVVGEVSWNATQARVFATLLAKVVPDLSATYHQHEINHKDIMELSRDELERIAAGIEEEVRKPHDSKESSGAGAKVVLDAKPTWEGNGPA